MVKKSSMVFLFLGLLVFLTACATQTGERTRFPISKAPNLLCGASCEPGESLIQESCTSNGSSCLGSFTCFGQITNVTPSENITIPCTLSSAANSTCGATCPTGYNMVGSDCTYYQNTSYPNITNDFCWGNIYCNRPAETWYSNYTNTRDCIQLPGAIR